MKDDMSEDDIQDVQVEADQAEEGIARDAEAKVHKLKNELEKVKAEKQEYLDGWQRAKADYVNLLKRSDIESAGAKQKGILEAIEALLPAYDALERAKAHGEVPEGFLGIAKQLESAFKELGIAPIGEVGEKFDPMLHEALAQEKTETEAADETVLAVLEPGYKLRDFVLRPAKVKVARYE